MSEFEVRYHTAIAQLEAEGLPDDADYAMHEDYIEWHYWSRVLEQTQKGAEYPLLTRPSGGANLMQGVASGDLCRLCRIHPEALFRCKSRTNT